VWIKYNLVPDIVRYAWFIVWCIIKAAHYRYHKWAVLQGKPHSASSFHIMLQKSPVCKHVKTTLGSWIWQFMGATWAHVILQVQSWMLPWLREASSHCTPFPGAW
jgi:amino acid permease